MSVTQKLPTPRTIKKLVTRVTTFAKKTKTAQPDFDVLIIGAGVSGIGSACHLTRNTPNKSYQILERRHSIGGTWDLFRYPGVRSDSDMSTFGFNFRPWKEEAMLAGGKQIKDYLIDTAREYKVTKNIRFGCTVTSQKWCSKQQLWTVFYDNEATGEQQQVTAKFLIGCTGYYSYDEAYVPDFKGMQEFQGQIIHPQFWPEGLDYTGKKVVVIGSGATAVTLVPSMADKAEKVTMLQRSPSYVFALPNKDVISEALRGKFSDLSIYRFSRVRNVAMQVSTFKLSKKFPKVVAGFLKYDAKRQLGKGFDMKHFTPHYNPWDQRMCAVPDGDLFAAIKSGRAEVVTDHVDNFTHNGIQLKSGKHIDADIIITATGLSLQLGGGSEMYVDEERIAYNEKLTYKGVLLEDVPNAAIIFGYINSSWTLKSDIAAEYICKLLTYMDTHNYGQVTAKDTGNNRMEETLFGQMSSGYIQRAHNTLPRQGKSGNWRVTHSVLADIRNVRFGKIKDDGLVFTKRGVCIQNK